MRSSKVRFFVGVGVVLVFVMFEIECFLVPL